MSVGAVIASTWALLLGMGLVMLGNGLQGTLVGLRASIEGFGAQSTGVVMTGYFVGFLAGSRVVPKLLANVGHIRVFAALASLASGAALLHAVFVVPGAWLAFRLLTGFCFAGLYVVAESWLNDVATNRTRGQLLSVYMVVMLGGMGAGQFLLNVADPGGFELFVLISLLVSLALIPISLSVSPAPAFEAPEPIGFRTLYRVSPLGVVGALLVGNAHAAFFGMGAVFGREIGLSVEELSLFMAAALFGGMVMQWPIGRLSDRFDRRKVLAVTAFAAALGCGWGLAADTGSTWALVAATAVLGGTSLPLYSLCIAHTNDHLTPRQIVAASAALVLVGGVGSSFGPATVGAAMTLAGPGGFFGFLAAVHAVIGGFAVYRMTRRDAVPLERQRSYGAVSSRTSPVGAAVAMSTVRDQRDREIARSSRW